MKLNAPNAVLTLLACALGGSVLAGPPETVPPARIPNYRLIAPGLAAAGQPAPEALDELGRLGFRTVVNLRAEKEGPAEERARVEAQGLRYVQVPITAESFSLADVEAVEKVLAQPSLGPVLLHCASSNRVGAVWAAIQVRRGRSFEEALAAGREAGLQSPAMVTSLRRALGLPAEPAVKP